MLVSIFAGFCFSVEKKPPVMGWLFFVRGDLMASKKEIEDSLVELRRISEHRTKGAEKKIRKLYKRVLKEMQEFLGVKYAEMSKDGTLTYAMLQQQGRYANFLDEVVRKLNGITPEETQIIRELTEQTYEASYNGMVEAVTKAKKSKNIPKALMENLKGIDGVTPEVVKRAVENPIAGLTLNDTLEKKRQEIIYNIKREIGNGLVQGDRYTDMARRVATSLDGDYGKAVRIVRTEAHRVCESGMSDAANEVDTALKKGKSGLIMTKEWCSMEDSRVRNTHQKMNGVIIKANEKFELPSGAKTDCPGNSGVASEDIHCRCFLAYDMMTEEEFEEAKGKR